MLDKIDETFVHDGSEWQLTGRVGKKPVYHKRDVNRIIGQMTIVEIKPANVSVTDPMMHKWVDPRELFHITEVENISVPHLKKTNDDALGRDYD